MDDGDLFFYSRIHIVISHVHAPLCLALLDIVEEQKRKKEELEETSAYIHAYVYVCVYIYIHTQAERVNVLI